jgi:hypothetical protein
MRPILRENRNPLPPSSRHDQREDGLYIKSFKIATRSAGVYLDEHEQLMALRAAGGSESQVRKLVELLHKERLTAAATILEKVVH